MVSQRMKKYVESSQLRQLKQHGKTKYYTKLYVSAKKLCFAHWNPENSQLIELIINILLRGTRGTDRYDRQVPCYRPMDDNNFRRSCMMSCGEKGIQSINY